MQYDPAIIADALPELAAERGLSAEDQAQLERDGHLVVRGLLSEAELAPFRPILQDAIARHEQEVGVMERKIYLFDSLWKKSAALRHFICAPRFARLAADALGVDEVRLWRDIPFCRTAGDNAPWHYDLTWEPLDTRRLVSVWIALSDITEDMGPVRFATGTHRIDALPVQPPDPEEQEKFTATLESMGHKVVDYAPLKAGDASLHFGWTMHSAKPNASSRRREALAIFFFPNGTRIALPPTPMAERDELWQRVQDFQLGTRLAGQQIGDVVDGDGCPLVFRR